MGATDLSWSALVMELADPDRRDCAGSSTRYRLDDETAANLARALHDRGAGGTVWGRAWEERKEA